MIEKLAGRSVMPVMVIYILRMPAAVAPGGFYRMQSYANHFATLLPSASGGAVSWLKMTHPVPPPCA
ncbi:hypothetical protein KCP77_22490 [Salmonella enterica subsp. enterica]|nr:hypothetical protein KCP77_22490 [Salmonella enterica subsp. enterica]